MTPEDDGPGAVLAQPFVHRDARALLVTPDGRYLMQLRDDFPHLLVPSHWGAFGGRVEDTESPRQAMVRELREELAFTPARLAWFTESAYALPQLEVPPTHVTFFEVPVTEADIAAMVLGEGAAMRLMTAEALLAEPRTVPWDIYGVLLHARRAVVFRPPAPSR